MKRTLAIIKEYKKESILAPLFKLFEASLELLVPTVMASIIDVGIAAGEAGKGYIAKMCLVLVGLGAVGLASSLTAQYFAAKAAVGFAAKLKHNLFAFLQKMSYTELDTLGAPTMITRMTSDVNQVQTGVNLLLRLLLRSPFVVLGAMIMAFILDAHSALVFLAAIPLLSIVVFAVMLVTIPLYRKVQQQLDSVLGITRENLTGVRVIRAFCKEQSEQEEFCRRSSALAALQRIVGRISALLNPATFVIVNIATAVLIYVGALRVNAGAISQGEVVALYNYMAMILVELIKLANLIITMTKSVACLKRIDSVFDIIPSQNDFSSDDRQIEKNSVKGDVCFKNVSLRYKNASADSLSNISFCAAAGETVGIIGGTGSGKTSLINLIPRFYEPSGGQVLIDGRDVMDYPLKLLREQIGVVPQKAVLFAGTIRENMRWGKPDASDDEIWEALSLAQADEIIRNKEGQLDFAVAQRGRNLSGGQLQRLTIARALVRKPPILILDDSASALDYLTEARLRASLCSLSYNPTVFIVSQRAASMRRADKIIVLNDGEIVGIGRHEQLMDDCPVYAEIFYSQFPKEA